MRQRWAIGGVTATGITTAKKIRKPPKKKLRRLVFIPISEATQHPQVLMVSELLT